MPVGGRGQEVSADWKCPTDGFQATTMRRALERGANESWRCATGRRGWERCESGRSNRVKTEPETRSPARGELRASSDASSSLNGAKVKVVGLRRPSGQQGFVARSLDCRQEAFAKAGAFCFFGQSLSPGPAGRLVAGAAGQSSLIASPTRMTPSLRICARKPPYLDLHDLQVK